ICELGIGSHVALSGALSEVQVFDLLSKADAFLLPSLQEAWPVSVMEAMGSGLPVIVSDVGATREMITSGVDGFLVTAGDEGARSEKIAVLAQNIDVRVRMGVDAHATAIRRFDVSVSARTLLELVRMSFYSPEDTTNLAG